MFWTFTFLTLSYELRLYILHTVGSGSTILERKKSTFLKLSYLSYPRYKGMIGNTTCRSKTNGILHFCWSFRRLSVSVFSIFRKCFFMFKARNVR